MKNAGNCPSCKQAITSEQGAVPILCPHCDHRLRADSPGFFHSVYCSLSKYATFCGRATRAEFWWFQLFVFITYQIIMTFDAGIIEYTFRKAQQYDISPDSLDEWLRFFRHMMQVEPATLIAIGLAELLFLAARIGLLIPDLSVTVRRLHDTGRSATSAIISFFLWIFPSLALAIGIIHSILTEAELEGGTLIIAFMCAFLLLLIASLISVYVIICCLQDSTRGPNQYGPSPKHPER